jgi:hypothetical protein
LGLPLSLLSMALISRAIVLQLKSRHETDGLHPSFPVT